MTTNEKMNKALMECYIELYNNSEPKADFELLLKNATIDERGEKVIDFDNYYIDEEIMSGIVDNIINKYKMKSYNKQKFKNTIYLGCSPSTKK
jgi:hypothetical protein